MKDLVEKGDYLLQDESLTNEIDNDEFDKGYYTSIMIAYVE